jgi:glycerophosphoryl diester phosphodiesterase
VLRPVFCVFVVTMTACSSSEPAAAPAPATTSEEDAGARPPPPIDPATFDCTSIGKPQRAPPSTLACVRDARCKGRFVAGHRGAGGELGILAPEDTLAAYRAAIALGVDLVETDPRPTSDGVIVNVHDTTVDRTTTGSGEVAAMTLAEVKALTLRAERYAGDFSCERIPTLEEVLTTAKGHAIVLVDANKTDRVDLLVAAMQKADALEWAVFDTSSVDKIDQALAIEPKLMIMPRVRELSEVANVTARWPSNPPIFVEIDQKMFPGGVAEIHAADLRTFTDVFVTDLGIRTSGKGDYLAPFEKGADAVQSDLPHEALKALGRF